MCAIVRVALGTCRQQAAPISHFNSIPLLPYWLDVGRPESLPPKELEIRFPGM